MVRSGPSFLERIRRLMSFLVGLADATDTKAEEREYSPSVPYISYLSTASAT